MSSSPFQNDMFPSTVTQQECMQWSLSFQSKLLKADEINSVDHNHRLKENDVGQKISKYIILFKTVR